MPNAAAWTGEQIDLITLGWEEGLSASQIADELWRKLRCGKSRNAIIGKLHRLGVVDAAAPHLTGARKGKPSPRSKPRLFRIKRPGIAAPSSAERAAIIALPPLEPRIDLQALRPGQCKFGCGDPREPGFAFCGRPAGESSWCPDHRRLVFQPTAHPVKIALKYAEAA